MFFGKLSSYFFFCHLFIVIISLSLSIFKSGWFSLAVHIRCEAHRLALYHCLHTTVLPQNYVFFFVKESSFRIIATQCTTCLLSNLFTLTLTLLLLPSLTHPSPPHHLSSPTIVTRYEFTRWVMYGWSRGWTLISLHQSEIIHVNV